jgi:hypothetical protein
MKVACFCFLKFAVLQAKEQHEDIKKIERENKARFVWFLFSLSSSPLPNGAFIYLVSVWLVLLQGF